MNKDQIQTGQAQEYWNVSGTRVLKYTVEMYHKGLKEHKLISAPEMDMLENKANLQAQKWTDKWESIESKRRINAEKEANLEEANLRTEAAIKSLTEIDNLLIHTLSIDDRVDWESLKKKEKYPEKSPAKPTQKRKKNTHPNLKNNLPNSPLFLLSLKNYSNQKKKEKFKHLKINFQLLFQNGKNKDLQLISSINSWIKISKMK
jgi:restriction system protein